MEDRENNNELSDAIDRNISLSGWQKFKEKEFDSKDLLLLSQYLSDSKSSVKDIQTCMGLCDADVQTLTSVQRVSSSLPIPKQKFVHQLLQTAWEKKQYKETWGELLSCLEKLGDQSLMENVHNGHFKGKHDMETLKKYSILTSGLQQENNPHECDVSLLVIPPRRLHIDETDLIEEEAVIQQSSDPIVQQSNQVYKMLLQRTPNFVRDKGSVPAHVDPDLARVKRVRENMKRLQRKFAGLLRKSFVAIQRVPDLAGSLRVFLNQRCVDKKGSIQLLEKRVLEITSHSTVEETFLLLSEIGAWDFINYEMLEDIISDFELEGLSQPITEHKKEISAFMDETVLADYLTVWDGCREMSAMTDRTPVIAKLKDDWGAYTLADVAEQKCNLASGFRLTSIVLQFENACSGSVYIVWSVPLAVAVYMQRMMESSDRPDLAQYGIEELVIGDKLNKICRNDDIYVELYTESTGCPEIFWRKMAFRFLQWITPFETTNSSDDKTGSIQWFKGGQLNVSVNCLDRHVSTEPSDHDERVALIQVKDSGYERITYRKLLAMTCQVANVLKNKGVTKGDTVAIYMPAIPLAVASMLACTRIGAVHCVIFPAYREQVLKQRLKEVRAKVIITVDETSKYQPVSQVDAVLNAPDLNDGKPTTVLVVQTSNDPSAVKMRGCYPLLEEEMKHQPTECTPVPMESEDPLCVVYSSGTGRDDLEPKPLYLSQAGYLVYNTLAHKYIFNCKPGDVFCCLAGLGWLAGQNSVVYGPLANGGTSVLFDGSPYGGRCFKLIDELEVTHFYTVPDVYKHLSTIDDSVFQTHDLSSLKVIATAGDVMPSDVETWCLDKLGKGRCSFIDTYGQTELGGTVLIRAKGKRPIHFPKTKDSFPFFGITPTIKKTDDCKASDSYELYIENYTNVPSLPTNVVEIHHKSFEGETYSTHDTVKLKQEAGPGHGGTELEGYWISGRVDDPVIELNAKYWGIAEVESHVTNTVNQKIGNVPKVNTVIVLPSESGHRDLSMSQTLYVWVASEELLQRLKETAPTVISAVDGALRELSEVQSNPPLLQFIFTDCIPKTLSGKRMNSALPSLSKTLFELIELWETRVNDRVSLKTVRAPCKRIRCAFESHPNVADHEVQSLDALRHSKSIHNNSMILQHVDSGIVCH